MRKCVCTQFNFVAALGLLSIAAVFVSPWLRERRLHALMYLAGMYLTFGVLQPMAHKVCGRAQILLDAWYPSFSHHMYCLSCRVLHYQEERFLTMTYPILCLGAALTLDMVWQAAGHGVEQCGGTVLKHRVANGIRICWCVLLRILCFDFEQLAALHTTLRSNPNVIVLCMRSAATVAAIVIIGGARSTGLVINFGAPLYVYAAIPSRATNGRSLRSPALPPPQTWVASWGLMLIFGYERGSLCWKGVVSLSNELLPTSWSFATTMDTRGIQGPTTPTLRRVAHWSIEDPSKHE